VPLSPRRSQRHAGNAGDQPGIDRAQLACALYGLTLLAAPAPILRAVPTRQPPDRRALLAARALGARHLVQAVTLMRRRGRGWMLLGASIDATYAATMLGLAIARPNRRTLATISATLAMLSAAAEIYALSHPPHHSCAQIRSSTSGAV
jgi:hypothetical protein